MDKPLTYFILLLFKVPRKKYIKYTCFPEAFYKQLKYDVKCVFFSFQKTMLIFFYYTGTSQTLTFAQISLVNVNIGQPVPVLFLNDNLGAI